MKKIIFLFILITISLSSWARVLTYSNIKYGPHERNVFDLWLPKKLLGKSPLVIFIHGGGFSSGDKSGILDYQGLIEKYNNNGIAVAAINYRFLKHTALHNIMREDIGGFVQFIRYHADDYKINKKLIMSFGSSAGGSASLWLGVHDDIKDENAIDPVKRESSRILAFAHLNAQAGYDFIDWYEYFGRETTDSFMKEQIWSRYHLSSVEDLLTPEGEHIRQELDSVENMDANDAHMYIYNGYNIRELANWNYDYFIHGPHHAKVLTTRATEVGLKIKKVVYAQNDKMPASLMNDVMQFFIDEIAAYREAKHK